MRKATLAVVLVATSCSPSSGGSDAPDRDPPIAVLAANSGSIFVLDSFALDASNSYDPDNSAPAPPHGIAEFVWEITSGSGTIEGTGATVSVLAHTSGIEMGQLVVIDEDGLESDPAVFTISATPRPLPVDLPLYIELAWDTDNVDVDLHFLEETAGGTFATPPHDTYYANPTPDWGVVGPENDPLCQCDDVNGFGPETVNLEVQAPGVTYRILGHYFSDDGLGSTTARVRIYLGGALAFEEDATLPATGALWDAVTITDGVVSAVDIVTP